jgi:hypothetical protein
MTKLTPGAKMKQILDEADKAYSKLTIEERTIVNNNAFINACQSDMVSIQWISDCKIDKNNGRRIRRQRAHKK